MVLCYIMPVSDILIILLGSGSISTADGSALVKVGSTTVICGIKAVEFHKHTS